MKFPLLLALLIFAPPVARCVESPVESPAGMFNQEFSRYGAVVRTAGSGSVATTDGKMDVMALIAAGPGGRGALAAEWFTVQRSGSGVRFGFLDSQQKDVGATQPFECTGQTSTSISWTERHEGASEAGHGLEIATYTAVIDAATGDMHIKMHSDLSVRRFFGLSQSHVSAEREVVFQSRRRSAETSAHP